ncbi:MAG: histidine triad nucleotide-binding protein [Acidimicrobiales bacterium]|nr:histidine triad nucleotide-binding protein [Acidimicrobiales bacterium]
MEDCLFCGIVSGDIPSDIVASSNLSVAFRDVRPGAPSHVLVVPKEHITDASTISPSNGAVVADMLMTAQEVAFIEKIHESGYRLVFNVGEDAGNSVPHLHLHVLGGRLMGWPPG